MSNFTEKDDMPDGQEPDHILSKSLRFGLGIPLVILFLICAIPLFWSAYSPIFCNIDKANSIKELGLDVLAKWCLATFIFLQIPWHKFGGVFSKIGPLEFQTVIAGRNIERAKLLTPIEIRLRELQEKISGLERVDGTVKGDGEPSDEKDNYPDINKVMEEDALSQLLLKFFEHYTGQFFSASRILKLGSRRTEFKEFETSKLSEMKNSIMLLLANGKITTMTSNKGNTIYGISKYA